MMKRFSILFTFLLTLSLLLVIGCDNGSVSEPAITKSSGLVQVSFTVDGDSSGLQKASSLEGFSFTYQYKAVPQWTSSDTIHGRTDNWTPIEYFDGMSLGFFTPGQWVFYLQILDGSTVVYEGHSDIIGISKSESNVTIYVTRIIPESTPGVFISVTAPTENNDSLNVKWGDGQGDSAVASKSSSGGITTFSFAKTDLAAGPYTFTLTHSNGQIQPYVISNVSVSSGTITLISGYLNNGEWNISCTTKQIYDVNLKLYNWNDEGWYDPSLNPGGEYYGAVDYISSAASGDRVSFSPRPVTNSKVISVSVKCGNEDVTYIRQGTLYLFIMPEGSVTISVKFSNANSPEVDSLLFKTVVRSLYAEYDVIAFGKYDDAYDSLPGPGAVTLGDVKIWYSNLNNKKKICWKAENAEGKAHLTDGSLSGLFSGHSKYTSISMDDIVTSDITDMSYMFQGCTGLQTLDLSGLDAGSVTNMSSMFQGCTGLQTLDLDNFVAGSATNISNIFQDCTSLQTLHLANFDAGGVADMSGMFQGCTNLQTLDLSGLDASSATDMSYMFQGCTNLVTLDLSNVTINTNSLQKVDMKGMFKDCVKLRGKDNVLNLSSFDTSRVKDMSYMFCGCKALTQINLSSFDTSLVENMSYMFSSVDTGTAGSAANKMNLTSLSVGHFDTSKVTNMSHMFYMCSNVNLTTLDVSNFDTSKVTDMSYMFGCWKDAPSYVAAINMSSWDFSNVKTVERMFDRCEKAVITFPSHTELTNIEDILYWFSHCFKVKTADLKNIIESWDFTGNTKAAALLADISTSDTNPEKTPSNRIIGNDMATQADYGTRKVYYTYNPNDPDHEYDPEDPECPENTNPIKKLYVGGNPLDIQHQRLTTDPLTPPSP